MGTAIVNLVTGRVRISHWRFAPTYDPTTETAVPCDDTLSPLLKYDFATKTFVPLTAADINADADTMTLAQCGLEGIVADALVDAIRPEALAVTPLQLRRTIVRRIRAYKIQQQQG